MRPAICPRSKLGMLNVGRQLDQSSGISVPLMHRDEHGMYWTHGLVLRGGLLLPSQPPSLSTYLSYLGIHW